MPYITIKYCLSEAGRKKNVMRGGNGKGVQTLNVFDDSECFTPLMEWAEVDASGNGTLDTTVSLDPEAEPGMLSIAPAEWDEVPTATAMLEKEQERRREYERVRARLDAQ